MKEYKLVETAEAGNLPMVVSVWSKLKHMIISDFDLDKPIVLELTAKEEKVLTEVHDFLFQEIEFPELHDFFFHKLNLFEQIRNFRNRNK